MWGFDKKQATDLFNDTVQSLGAADVKADQDGIGVGVRQRPHVVVIGGSCGFTHTKNESHMVRTRSVPAARNKRASLSQELQRGSSTWPYGKWCPLGGFAKVNTILSKLFSFAEFTHTNLIIKTLVSFFNQSDFKNFRWGHLHYSILRFVGRSKTANFICSNCRYFWNRNLLLILYRAARTGASEEKWRCSCTVKFL